MSTIKGNGAPTRQTAGSIGDIYIDTITSKKYKCTNAYGVAGQFDYTWRAIQDDAQNGDVKSVETKAETKVEEPKVEEQPTEEAPAEKVKKPAKEARNNKRTNYSAAYDKKEK